MRTHVAATPPTISTGRRAAKRLALVVDGVRPQSVGAVVLAYHRVGGRTNSPVDLSTAMFRRQMSHIRAALSPVSLDALIDDVESVENADALMSITFDDGTADFVDVALPVLVEYQLPVTLYLSTSFVDTGREYPANGQPVSWGGLREALSTGLVTIGAHTHNHVLLDRCSLDVAATELDTCNQRIEDELGVSPRHFAYPKAVAANGAVEALVRGRYRSAAIAGTRPNIPGETNPYRLYRSPIQNADGWEGFSRKVRGGMRTEDDVRRIINLARYRGKTS